MSEQPPPTKKRAWRSNATIALRVDLLCDRVPPLPDKDEQLNRVWGMFGEFAERLLDELPDECDGAFETAAVDFIFQARMKVMHGISIGREAAQRREVAKSDAAAKVTMATPTAAAPKD